MNKQLFLKDLILHPAPSLDNFIVGKNQELIALLQPLPKNHAIYLWGEAGSGKTHLLQALAQKQGTFYKHSSFPSELEQLPILCQNKRLLIDDIHLFSEAQHRVLFHLYNEWQARKQANAFALVVTGEKAPLHTQLREDLRNRLGWGLVYELHLLNDHDCQHALTQRATEKGLQLRPEVLQWIFTYYSRDIRMLFALLDALDAYSLSQKRPITVPLLKKLLHTEDFA